jgi:hypothetical protein
VAKLWSGMPVGKSFPVGVRLWNPVPWERMDVACKTRQFGTLAQKNAEKTAKSGHDPVEKVGSASCLNRSRKLEAYATCPTPKSRLDQALVRTADLERTSFMGISIFFTNLGSKTKIRVPAASTR